jgi:3-phosphoglycerate kinase
MGLDAGPKSQKLFRETVLSAKTILWNGSVVVRIITYALLNVGLQSSRCL